MGGGHLKIFLKNAEPEELIFLKAVWHNVDKSLFTPWSRGSRGATLGKTKFTCVYIEKKKHLQNQQANFNQTWYKPSLGEENKNLLNEGQVQVQVEIITKMQRWVEAIEFFLLLENR
jgi:hypothetical protein